MSGAKWDMFLGRKVPGGTTQEAGDPRGHAPIHLPAGTETATF